MFKTIGNIEEIYEKLETIGWKDDAIKTKEEQPCVDQHDTPDTPSPASDSCQVPKTFKDIAQHQIAVYESKNADYGSATVIRVLGLVDGNLMLGYILECLRYLAGIRCRGRSIRGIVLVNARLFFFSLNSIVLPSDCLQLFVYFFNISDSFKHS